MHATAVRACSWTVNTGFITAAKFFMYVLIVAHLLACGFYLWPTLHTCEASDEERAGNSSGDWAMADAADPTSHLTSHEHRDKWLDTCVAGAWRDKYGLHGLTSWEQYIQVRAQSRHPFETVIVRRILWGGPPTLFCVEEEALAQATVL